MKWVFLVDPVNAASSNRLSFCFFFSSSSSSFGHRIKAYTHELSVIDFIIVVFLVFLYEAYFVRLVFASSSAHCIHFSVIYFNLFVLARREKQYASLIHTWFESTQNCWLIWTVFLYVIYLFIDSNENVFCVRFFQSIMHLAFLAEIYVPYWWWLEVNDKN